MKDSQRLGRSGSPFVRELLAAGREERPSARTTQRALVALGTAATALTAPSSAAGLTSAAAGTAAAASKTAGAGVGAAMIAKWVGVGVVAGAAAVGAAGVIEPLVWPEPAAVPAESQSVPAAKLVAPSPPPSEPASLPPLEIKSDPSQPKVPVRSFDPVRPSDQTAAPGDSALAREVALLDQARAALRGGDTTSATRLLDAYDDQSEVHHLSGEALYIRMETLVRAGKPRAAAAVARRLLELHPHSAHAARARDVAAAQQP